MTEPVRYGDALNAPFWEAARRHELVLQHCGSCGVHQLYARPFCLACGSEAVGWVAVAGTGIVYSVTTVRVAFSTEHEPPYAVGLVELDEGVRFLTSLPNGCRIGERVHVAWKERDPDPPLPVFTRADEGGTP